MDLGVPPQRAPQPRDANAGRVPLAVVVVDAAGLVSHWSTGARRLFGVAREDAIGCPAGELLPVSGVLRQDGEPGPDGTYAGSGHPLDSSLSGSVAYPAAGRARVDEPRRGRIDVLWWAYPLVGPGPERLLVLAADAGQLCDAEANGSRDSETIAPGFALHTDFPGYQDP
ncbi:PAS sensor protein, partial [Streptomyces sp. NPDC059744]